jgi:hypothetical protein
VKAIVPFYRGDYQESWRHGADSIPKAAPTVETYTPRTVLYDSQGKPLTRKRVAGFVETSR